MENKTYTHLEKWENQSNYLGEDYTDRYVVLSHSRDSGIIDESNFQAACKELGLDYSNNEEPRIVRFNSWGCGWFESILIPETETELLEKADKILERISQYPILDESDFSSRETEEADNLFEELKKDIENGYEYTKKFEGYDDEQLLDYCYESVRI